MWRTRGCAGVDGRPQQHGVTEFTDRRRPASTLHASRLVPRNSGRHQAHQPQVCRPHTSSTQRTQTGLSCQLVVNVLHHRCTQPAAIQMSLRKPRQISLRKPRHISLRKPRHMSLKKPYFTGPKWCICVSFLSPANNVETLMTHNEIMSILIKQCSYKGPDDRWWMMDDRWSMMMMMMMIRVLRDRKLQGQ